MIRNTFPRDDVSIDHFLETLSVPLRRTLLNRLREENPPKAIDIVDLLDELVEESAHSREELTITLHHNHLPALETTGLIEVDDDRRTIRYKKHDRVERILDTLTEIESDG